MAPVHTFPLPERLDTHINSNFSTPYDPITGDCLNINGCRTIFGILWSCVSVVLICTWVAIHSDVPRIPTHPIVILYQNLELMFAALLSPELVILWATRQWTSVSNMIKRDPLKKRGWGKAHAFFILMRGLVVYDDKDSKGVELYREIRVDTPRASNPNEAITFTIYRPENEHAEKMYETFPLDDLISKGTIILSESEVKDRSHADLFAKLIALLQTTWFVVQVFARVAEGLALSELEILAIGFALLNFGTFFLWWSKPLRVQYPIRIFWKYHITDPSPRTQPTWRIWIRRGCLALLQHIWDKDPEKMAWGDCVTMTIMLPLYMGWRIFGICATMLDEDIANIWDLDISEILFSRTSDAESDKGPLRLYLPVYLVSFAFGAVHCIPWFFQFPTHIEQWFWRISALVVVVSPIAAALVHVYGKLLVQHKGSSLKTAVRFTAPLLFGLYASARLALLALALIALRDLPSSALQTTQWTTFIPHIG